MATINDSAPDLLLAADIEVAERERILSAGPMSREERDASMRELLGRRTLREKLVDGLRRAWYGPDPEPLTAEDMRMIMQVRGDDDELPERVPPDDPERLAFEAELRALGIRPAKKWNWPVREPIRRPTLWERIKYRVSRGW